MAFISATFASDDILSFGGYNSGSLFPGLFRSDEIIPFYNKNLQTTPTSGIIPGITFISDTILPFYAQALQRLPLTVYTGGGTQTPKYYIG